MIGGECPQPTRTLVVILGASEFPGDARLSNPRFLRSAEALREYFLDPFGFDLPKENMLWLFDAQSNPTQLNDDVEEFLKTAVQRPEVLRPLDVIVYYVGHGFFGDDKSYYLATRTLRPASPEYSYRFKLLQRTVKEVLRGARKFYILDACYSGAAAREMMGTNPVASRVIGEAAREASDELPTRGTAVLCAASPDDLAMAPSKESTTMFTGALLEVLTNTREGGVSVLSLQQLHRLVKGTIQERFAKDAVRPQIHVPDQKAGDVGNLPLFPLRRRTAADRPDFGDAYDPGVFAEEGPVRVMLVGCLGVEGGVASLAEAVRLACEDYRDEIVKAANLVRDGLRLAKVPTDRPDGGLVRLRLAVERAFSDEGSLMRAVAALCQAEVAIFDMTQWDEVTTFLLGVRAVARRGITVCSIGGEFTIGAELAVPFNLQLLNLSSHSEKQEDRGNGMRPSELIGGKITNGFRELAHLPHYLDLPAFDSVRQLGVESTSYYPILVDKQVLVLCPFGREYSDANWRRLEKELPGKLKNKLKLAERPRLVRLLDFKTPRLVAQTLFEAIRLTDMCLLDWTGLRTNVIFEAGVRMAVNPLGAVHVIEKTTNEQLRGSGEQTEHLKDMLRVFSPVPYFVGPADTLAYEEMISRFEANREESSKGITNCVYRAVGEALDHRHQPVAQPVIEDLIRSANILEGEEQESTGIFPVLYHEVNRSLVNEALTAAAERRLAAWLYLTHRWSADEIVQDERLLGQFELLSIQVRRWARNMKRDDIKEEVDRRTKAIKEVARNRESVI